MRSRETHFRETPLSMAVRLLGGRTEEVAYAFSGADDRLQGPAPKSPHAPWIGKLITGAWIIGSLFAFMSLPFQTALIASGVGLMAGITLAILIGTFLHWGAYR